MKPWQVLNTYLRPSEFFKSLNLGLDQPESLDNQFEFSLILGLGPGTFAVAPLDNLGNDAKSLLGIHLLFVCLLDGSINLGEFWTFIFYDYDYDHETEHF